MPMRSLRISPLVRRASPVETTERISTLHDDAAKGAPGRFSNLSQESENRTNDTISSNACRRRCQPPAAADPLSAVSTPTRSPTKSKQDNNSSITISSVASVSDAERAHAQLQKMWDEGELSPRAPLDRSLGYFSSSPPVSSSKAAAAAAAAGKVAAAACRDVFISDVRALRQMAPFSSLEEQVLTRSQRRRSSANLLQQLVAAAPYQQQVAVAAAQQHVASAAEQAAEEDRMLQRRRQQQQQTAFQAEPPDLPFTAACNHAQQQKQQSEVEMQEHESPFRGPLEGARKRRASSLVVSALSLSMHAEGGAPSQGGHQEGLAAGGSFRAKGRKRLAAGAPGAPPQKNGDTPRKSSAGATCSSSSSSSMDSRGSSSKVESPFQKLPPPSPSDFPVASPFSSKCCSPRPPSGKLQQQHLRTAAAAQQHQQQCGFAFEPKHRQQQRMGSPLRASPRRNSFLSHFVRGVSPVPFQTPIGPCVSEAADAAAPGRAATAAAREAAVRARHSVASLAPFPKSRRANQQMHSEEAIPALQLPAAAARSAAAAAATAAVVSAAAVEGPRLVSVLARRPCGAPPSSSSSSSKKGADRAEAKSGRDTAAAAAATATAVKQTTAAHPTKDCRPTSPMKSASATKPPWQRPGRAAAAAAAPAVAAQQKIKPLPAALPAAAATRAAQQTATAGATDQPADTAANSVTTESEGTNAAAAAAATAGGRRRLMKPRALGLPCSVLGPPSPGSSPKSPFSSTRFCSPVASRDAAAAAPSAAGAAAAAAGLMGFARLEGSARRRPAVTWVRGLSTKQRQHPPAEKKQQVSASETAAAEASPASQPHASRRSTAEATDAAKSTTTAAAKTIGAVPAARRAAAGVTAARRRLALVAAARGKSRSGSSSLLPFQRRVGGTAACRRVRVLPIAKPRSVVPLPRKLQISSSSSSSSSSAVKSRAAASGDTAKGRRAVEGLRRTRGVEARSGKAPAAAAATAAAATAARQRRQLLQCQSKRRPKPHAPQDAKETATAPAGDAAAVDVATARGKQGAAAEASAAAPATAAGRTATAAASSRTRRPERDLERRQQQGQATSNTPKSEVSADFSSKALMDRTHCTDSCRSNTGASSSSNSSKGSSIIGHVSSNVYAPLAPNTPYSAVSMCAVDLERAAAAEQHWRCSSSSVSCSSRSAPPSRRRSSSPHALSSHKPLMDDFCEDLQQQGGSPSCTSMRRASSCCSVDEQLQQQQQQQQGEALQQEWEGRDREYREKQQSVLAEQQRKERILAWEQREAELLKNRKALSKEEPFFWGFDPFMVDEEDEKVLTTEELRTEVSRFLKGDLRFHSRADLLRVVKKFSEQTRTTTTTTSSRLNFTKVEQRVVPMAARQVHGTVPHERRRKSILRNSNSNTSEAQPVECRRRSRGISFSPFNKVQLYMLDEHERASKEAAANLSQQGEQRQQLRQKLASEFQMMLLRGASALELALLKRELAELCDSEEEENTAFLSPTLAQNRCLDTDAPASPLPSQHEQRLNIKTYNNTDNNNDSNGTGGRLPFTVSPSWRQRPHGVWADTPAAPADWSLSPSPTLHSHTHAHTNTNTNIRYQAAETEASNCWGSTIVDTESNHDNGGRDVEDEFGNDENENCNNANQTNNYQRFGGAEKLLPCPPPAKPLEEESDHNIKENNLSNLTTVQNLSTSGEAPKRLSVLSRRLSIVPNVEEATVPMTRLKGPRSSFSG